MLTLSKLKAMKPGIFDSGTVRDSSTGVNILGSGKMLRWVAVRGGIHDWAIYVYWEAMSEEWIKAHGDKVHDRNNIKRLVKCDDEALGMYRD